MNDFLAALIDRAEGRLPLLARRPRSLFEPASGEADSSARSLAFRSEQDETASASAAVSDAKAHALAGRARDEMHAASRVAPAPERGLRAPSARRESGASIAAVATTVPRHEFAARDEGPTPPHEARRIAANTLARDPHASSRITPSPARDGSHGDADARTNAQAPPRAGALEPSRTSAVKPAVMLAKAQTTGAARRDATPVEAPPPVRISIGRIEIRAVQSVAAIKPRAPASTAPRLSLDDYLRTRNRGAR